MTDGYAQRRLEIVVRDRARFGGGVVAELPTAIADVGGMAAFVVTDRGVVGSGVAGRVVDLLRDAGVVVELFDGVEPNPSADDIERATKMLRAFIQASGGDGTVVVGLGGGSAMDSPRSSPSTRPISVLSCHLATTMKR